MRSLAVFTKNMDDLDLGVAELKEKLKDFKFGRNSLGVVFAHAETDFEELGEKLREELWVVVPCHCFQSSRDMQRRVFPSTFSLLMIAALPPV